MQLTLIVPLLCVHRPRGPVHSVHVSSRVGTQTVCIHVFVCGIMLQVCMFTFAITEVDYFKQPDTHNFLSCHHCS